MLLARLVKALARRKGYQFYRIGEAWQLVEPEKLQQFFKHFAVDCVFDIGANEGQYAQGLRALGYTGLILSFEPIPQAAAVARDRARDDAQWHVFELALDAQVRDTTFNVMEGSQYSSLRSPLVVEKDDIKAQNFVRSLLELRTTTLDEQVPPLQARFGFRRPFLKMDTQGNDVAVVEGGARVLAGFVGLQSELAFERLYQGMPDFAEALAVYRSKGFRLSALVPNNRGHWPDLLEVDCIMYNAALSIPD